MIVNLNYDVNNDLDLRTGPTNGVKFNQTTNMCMSKEAISNTLWQTAGLRTDLPAQRFSSLIHFMVALWNRADHYIFALWFLLPIFFFFCSPNLSRRRLGVCHTSTHGVALVRISDAGLKNVLHTARCKYRTQKSRQKSPSAHRRTNWSGYIFATKARIDNRNKKLVKQQYVLQMSLQYGELRPTSGCDRSGSLGHPS